MPIPPKKWNNPVITEEPVSICIDTDGSGFFTLTAVGPPGLTYQWQILSGGDWVNVTDGGSYSGATTDTLTIDPADAGLDGGQYRCVVEWNINRYNISVVVSLQVGGCTPTECACALLIPQDQPNYFDPFPSGPVFADYATAEIAIADQVYDCALISIPPNVGELTPWTLDTSTANEVTAILTKSGTSLSDNAEVTFLVSLKAGTLAVDVGYSWGEDGEPEEPLSAFSITITPVCPSEGSPFSLSDETDGFSITGSDNYTVPQDGNYLVVFNGNFDGSGDGGAPMQCWC